MLVEMPELTNCEHGISNDLWMAAGGGRLIFKRTKLEYRRITKKSGMEDKAKKLSANVSQNLETGNFGGRMLLG